MEIGVVGAGDHHPHDVKCRIGDCTLARAVYNFDPGLHLMIRLAYNWFCLT
jgi:hypothetical protein